MTFVSYGFFVFLVCSVIIYYLVPGPVQWPVLLAISVVFYLSNGPKYFIYVIITSVSVWALALAIEREQSAVRAHTGDSSEEKKRIRSESKKKQKRILLAGVILNVGILVILKYTNFAILNINVLLRMTAGLELNFTSWLLPLGISYYTLQAVSYIIDVYHGTEEAEKNYFKVLLFTSFFPQVIQGPISRFGELKESLFSSHEWSPERIKSGSERILWGFFKKLVVADRVAPVVSAVSLNPEAGGIYTFIGMLAYTLELYGDFTGGIDIALGCAELFGVTLPENFDLPFSSGSLAEYWRRWHMSLMKWFREYVFYPVSVCGKPKRLISAVKQRFGKKAGAKIPVWFATALTWLLTGMWHGASWNFIIWGMANCFILLISQELTPLYRNFHKRFAFSESGWYRKFTEVRTLLLVSAVQMFEYYGSCGTAVRTFFGIFTDFRISAFIEGGLSVIGISAADAVILVIAVIIFCIVGSLKKKGPVRKQIASEPGALRAVLWFGLFLCVLIFGVYGIGYDAAGFIYNQF